MKKEGSVVPIELQGITRNKTCVGMKDGQCEDILNLRFKNGSWRPSGDGKLVFSMGEKIGTTPHVEKVYSQLFIHTNVYRHLLGVRNNHLYWFANIDADGVFSAIPAEVLICSVQGNLSITQNGNLVTIIDLDDDDDKPAKNVVYALYKERLGKYDIAVIDENGSSDSRDLYPYGRVNINLDCSETDDHHIESKYDEDIDDWGNDVQVDGDDTLNYAHTSKIYTEPDVWHAQMVEAYNKAQEKNIFTRPFLAMVAVKLYDGTYTFASEPVLLFPREKLSSHRYGFSSQGIMSSLSDKNIGAGMYHRLDISNPKESVLFFHGDGQDNDLTVFNQASIVYTSPNTYIDTRLSYMSYAYTYMGGYNLLYQQNASKNNGGIVAVANGADILLNISDLSVIKEHRDIFTGVGIFITPEVDLFETTADKDHYGQVVNFHVSGITHRYFSYCPKMRSWDKIKHDLINSPFFLLRDYDTKELDALQNGLKVDLSDPKYEAVLKNITQQYRFTSEATERKQYLPKVAYNYNGRLHIANYTSNLFHGYTPDSILFNNHSGVREENANDLCLKNFNENDDNHYVQFQKKQYKFVANGILDSTPRPLSYVAANVWIETNDGDSIVTRYIAKDMYGYANFFEDLPPILTYPDSRAFKMELVFIQLGFDTNNLPSMKTRSVSFNLKPHPCYNMAYVWTTDLIPYDLSALAITYTTPAGTEKGYRDEQNTTENFPNYMKVSATDNPMSFPYKNTYKVGSSEVLALCSNAVAVGEGQTGASPLYGFCKDGIYAFFVDTSGEFVYTNSRIIARDVVNTPKSVTPIDMGVAFTTDRGLMIIAGQKVDELGKAVAGDVLDYKVQTTSSAFAPATFGNNLITLISELPNTLCDGIDFLTYIQGAILNYDHHNRELLISNPSYAYSYAMDENMQFTRRDNKALEYVNNYPTSYRVDSSNTARTLYKVDEESDGREEADNKILALTQPIKLGTLGFKQSYRCVARGRFNTQDKGDPTETTTPKVVHEPVSKTLTGVALASSNAQRLFLQNVALSNEQTFTVSTGDDGVMQVTFNGAITFTPAANNVINGGSRLHAYYKIRKQVSATLWVDVAVIPLPNALVMGNSMQTTLTKELNQSVVLQDGTYSVKVEATFVDISLRYTGADTARTYTVQGIDATHFTTQTISRPAYNQVVASQDIIIGAEGGSINSGTMGYVDFVCDSAHAVSAKLCKLLPSYTSNIRMSYRIIKLGATVADNVELGNYKFYSARLETTDPLYDYVLRVDTTNAGIGQIELSQGTYRCELVIDTIDVKLEFMGGTHTVSDKAVIDGDQQYMRGAGRYVHISDYEVCSNQIQITENLQDTLTIAMGIAGRDELIVVAEDGDLNESIISVEGARATLIVTDENNVQKLNVDAQSVTTITQEGERGVKKTIFKWQGTGGIPYTTQLTSLPAGTYTCKIILRYNADVDSSSDETLNVYVLTNQQGGASVYSTIEPKYTYEAYIPATYSFREVFPTETTDRQKAEVSYISKAIPAYGLTNTTTLSIGNVLTTTTPASKTITQGASKVCRLGIYVLGSNDGRKWELLGANEKTGNFVDIGCITERTDVRYLRIALAGNLKKDSRFDFFEIAATGSDLNNKPR